MTLHPQHPRAKHEPTTQSDASFYMQVVFYDVAGAEIEGDVTSLVTAFDVQQLGGGNTDFPHGSITLADVDGDPLFEKLLFGVGTGSRVDVTLDYDSTASNAVAAKTFKLVVVLPHYGVSPEGSTLTFDVQPLASAQHALGDADLDFSDVDPRSAGNVAALVSAAADAYDVSVVYAAPSADIGVMLADDATKAALAAIPIERSSAPIGPPRTNPLESAVDYVSRILARYTESKYKAYAESDGAIWVVAGASLSAVGIAATYSVTGPEADVIDVRVTDETYTKALLAGAPGSVYGFASKEGVVTKEVLDDINAGRATSDAQAAIARRDHYYAVNGRSAGEIRAEIAKRIDAAGAALQVELTVRGTHGLTLQTFVQLNWQLRSGRQHPVSGIYRVLAIAHTVAPGDWSTMLSLSRHAPLPSQPSGLMVADPAGRVRPVLPAPVGAIAQPSASQTIPAGATD